MKALTITQPWASLIVLGHKSIENRTWPTRYRGRLLIHSSKRGFDSSGLVLAGRLGIELPDDLPRGAILGAADLVNVTDIVPADDPFAFGPVCWVLANATAFASPLPCRGSLGLWKPPAELPAEFQIDAPRPAAPAPRSGNLL